MIRRSPDFHDAEPHFQVARPRLDFTDAKDFLHRPPHSLTSMLGFEYIPRSRENTISLPNHERRSVAALRFPASGSQIATSLGRRYDGVAVAQVTTPPPRIVSSSIEDQPS
jgi:hypothetical protein